jgi:putative transposase
MARRRHTPEQIIRKLREADRLLGAGADIADVARHLEVSEQTYHRWRNQFGGMKADGARRLKDLERENARLKRIVADKELEIDALREVAKGKLVSPSRRRWAVVMLCDRLGMSQRRACEIVGQHRSTQRHQPAGTPISGPPTATFTS